MELRLSTHQNNKFNINKVKLTEEQSANILDARIKLNLIFECEELYDQVIESHLAFKKELYASSIFSIGKRRRDFIANHEIRSRLNRLVFNTLNLSKLYLDKHYYEHKKIM